MRLTTYQMQSANTRIAPNVGIVRTAPTRTIFELPNEILNDIFQLLPAHSLCALCCTAPRFKDVAERHLYCSITISDHITPSSPSPIKTLRCCESLLRRRHLFENVKRFHIRWQAGAHPISTTSTFIYACESLRGILRHVPYLESLELSLGPANAQGSTYYHLEPLHAIERAIQGCRLSHLQYCSLNADGRHPYSTIIRSFLRFTPSLRHLKLNDLSTTLDLPLDALPRLISFRGSPAAASSILPGRPISLLSLIGQDSDVTPDNLPQMVHTTVPIRVLDLSAMSIRPVLLNHISKYLPHLHVLKVKLALSHTLHYASSGIAILIGLTAVLSEFSLLTHLDLSATVLNTTNVGSMENEQSLCSQWSLRCPSLRRIIFPSRREWSLSNIGWAVN